MMIKKQQPFHPRNAHQGHYDFAALTAASPELKQHLLITPRGEQSINFSDSEAVKCLNTALLKLHYQIEFWQLPPGYLCPPVPGRADYIHALADLLSQSTGQSVAQLSNANTQVLDIGTGASCIYPLLGARQYGWRFVGTDIDKVSVDTARVIVQHNRGLPKLIKLRLQQQPKAIFHGVINENDKFQLTLCNPPFYRSVAEAQAANSRKVTNLARHKGAQITPNTVARNFGGQNAELWCEGGELAFISQMISESRDYAQQVLWFSSLVSNKDHLPILQKALRRAGVAQVQILEMGQGQKVSRALAWSFTPAPTDSAD